MTQLRLLVIRMKVASEAQWFQLEDFEDPSIDIVE